MPGDDVIADRKLADAVTQAIVDHIEVLRGRRQGVEAEVQIPYEPADRLATLQPAMHRARRIDMNIEAFGTHPLPAAVCAHPGDGLESAIPERPVVLAVVRFCSAPRHAVSNHLHAETGDRA